MILVTSQEEPEEQQQKERQKEWGGGAAASSSSSNNNNNNSNIGRSLKTTTIAAATGIRQALEVVLWLKQIAVPGWQSNQWMGSHPGTCHLWVTVEAWSPGLFFTGFSAVVLDWGRKQQNIQPLALEYSQASTYMCALCIKYIYAKISCALWHITVLG